MWEFPFDPERTAPANFHLDNGGTVTTSMMYTQPRQVAFTELDGYQILDMPFADGSASMVFVLPPQQSGAQHLTTELLTDIDDWLESSPYLDFLDVYLPKFQTTVSTRLNQLLIGMGVPSAFGAGADFSAMTSAPVWIDKVFHKAALEVNEQGTEAAAATEVAFILCFAEGTPVLTPDGEKPIEQLKAGDFVLARDEHNLEGRLEPKLIEKTLKGHADIIELRVGGQTIRTTNAHPFFVEGRGWTPAGELKAKDRLSSNYSDWVEVETVTATNVAEPVYNMKVADYHTYFIGSKAWRFAVWAHNDYGHEFNANRPFHFLIRDNTTSTTTFMGRINDPTQLENDLAPSVQQKSADFDSDLDIDGADFLIWQRGFGTPTPDATKSVGDADNDLDVDVDDLDRWGNQFGQGVGLLAASSMANQAAPAEVAIIPAASAIESTAFAVLIDAAMATELLSASMPGDEIVVDEEQPLAETSFGPVFAPSDQQLPTALSSFPVSSSTSAAQPDKARVDWFSDHAVDEVFERVFV